MVELIEKWELLINKFNAYRESMIGNDIISLFKGLDEANEYVSKLSKFSNDTKLAYAWYCIGKDIDIERSINEIYTYVSDQDRAFFVSNEFKKILLSNSIQVSCIRALILGKVVHEDRMSSHEDAIILQLLDRVTDFDLQNYKELIENDVQIIGNRKVIHEAEIKGEKAESYRLTLQLLYSNGLLGMTTSIITDGTMYTGTFYTVSEITYGLMSYIEEVKQVLGYFSK